MGFNWFNRQHNKRSEKSEPEVKEDQQVQPEAPEADAQPESGQTPAIAEDYLSWAKTAYQNIQKRQKEAPAPEPETAPEPEAQVEAVDVAPEAAPETASETATAPPEVEASPAEVVAEIEESSADAETPAIASPSEAEDSNAIVVPDPLVNEAQSIEPSASVELEAQPEVEPEPIASEPVAEDRAAEEPVAEVESEIEPEPEPEAEEPVAEVEPEPEPEPVVEAEPEPEPVAEAEPATALPFWARAEAERLERLERLKAEAIEAVEPEVSSPVGASAAESSDLMLDESFLWSAEVLASQGRRPEDISLEEITWLKRLRQGLDKTRRSLVNQLRSIVGQGPLNQEAVMEIESLLLQADVGIEATDYIIEALQSKLRQEVLPPNEAIAYLKQILRDMLDNPQGQPYDPKFTPEKGELNVWLMTGVNGAGKTTTIGKLAHLARKSDYSCLIAAADTFRAAAVEQVKIWGQRSNVEVIANPGKNTDPAAVVFDAITAAQSRGAELLLVDTAGRLQNKKNLMDELSKVRRIIDKKAPNAKIESLLVLDATLGQNGLRQAEVFSEAAQLSGVVITKLDGTAKGGIALAVVKQLGLPIRFIGVGEGIEDLRPFSSYEFIEALLSG